MKAPIASSLQNPLRPYSHESAHERASDVSEGVMVVAGGGEEDAAQFLVGESTNDGTSTNTAREKTNRRKERRNNMQLQDAQSLISTTSRSRFIPVSSRMDLV